MDANGQWTPVQSLTDYPCVKGQANTVQFNAISTTALRLEIDQPDQFSIGLYEWEVK